MNRRGAPAPPDLARQGHIDRAGQEAGAPILRFIVPLPLHEPRSSGRESAHTKKSQSRLTSAATNWWWFLGPMPAQTRMEAHHEQRQAQPDANGARPWAHKQAMHDRFRYRPESLSGRSWLRPERPHSEKASRRGSNCPAPNLLGHRQGPIENRQADHFGLGVMRTVLDAFGREEKRAGGVNRAALLPLPGQDVG